jgi:hypothetical protein
VKDFILLMRTEGAPPAPRPVDAWPSYFATLRDAKAFEGGSTVGDGVLMSKAPTSNTGMSPISGYIRVRAESLEAACALVTGNPVYEAGGTVEVRELPRSD